MGDGKSRSVTVLRIWLVQWLILLLGKFRVSQNGRAGRESRKFERLNERGKGGGRKKCRTTEFDSPGLKGEGGKFFVDVPEPRVDG